MDVAKKSDSVQLRYSMPTTNDSGNTNCIQWSLYIIMSVQIISPLFHMVLVRISFKHCDKTHFASYSWYIATGLIITSLVLAVLWYFMRKMLATFIFLIFQCIVCALLAVYESFTLRCTTQTFEITSFCVEFRQILNDCPPLNGTEKAIPEDTFRIGRILTVFFALLTLFCGIAICIVIAVSMKTGKDLSRHRIADVVVGVPVNSITAHQNRQKNVQILILPSAAEVEKYERKRMDYENSKSLGKQSILKTKQSILLRQSLKTEYTASDKEKSKSAKEKNKSAKEKSLFKSAKGISQIK